VTQTTQVAAALEAVLPALAVHPSTASLQKPLLAQQTTLQVLTIAPLLFFVPVRTPLVRNGHSFGYVLTKGGDPTPSADGAELEDGVLWVEAATLGGELAFEPGFVGISFSRATMSVVGGMQFGPAGVQLDPSAELSFELESAIADKPAAQSPDVGQDFLATTLTPFPGATVRMAPAGTTIELSGAAPAKAQAYGQELEFVPAANAPAGMSDEISATAIVLCDCDTPEFTASVSQSTEFALSGSAPVQNAAVMFPISAAAPEDLPEPVKAWGMVAVLGAGLEARFGALGAPIPTAGALIEITPTALRVLVEPAAALVADRHPLWAPPPEPQPSTNPDLALPPSLLTIEIPRKRLIELTASVGLEIVTLRADIAALLDRPLAADGTQIPLRGSADILFALNASGRTVTLLAELDDPNRSLALVGENAVIPVGPPRRLFMFSNLDGDQLAHGVAWMEFPNSTVVPTLPDPYVADYFFRRGREPVAAGEVVVLLQWTPNGPPALQVLTGQLAAAIVAAAFVPGFDEGQQHEPSDVFGGFSDGRTSRLTLLDVSTNADLWGIGLFGQGTPQFDGLRLTGDAGRTLVMAPPGISWEPVVDGDSKPLHWLAAESPDDGTPTTFIVMADARVPIVPAAALQQYTEVAGKRRTAALFTLPFGISAALDDTEQQAGFAGKPTYQIPFINFAADGLTGARVLSIRATESTDYGKVLPGSAEVGFVAANPAYGAKVIGIRSQPNAEPPDPGESPPVPALLFDEQFAPGGTRACVPVARVDLSGWGTSVYSDWFNPFAQATGVVRADFKVPLGRTAHELVQFQIRVLPWSIRLQRTVVFDRSDGGEVVKHDSGWVAVGDGKFELLKPGRVMDGPVNRLTNVRNVNFDGANLEQWVNGKTHEYTPVTFDADVVFDGDLQIEAHGKPATSVFGFGIKGYATATVSDTAPTPDEILGLLAVAESQLGTSRVPGSTACVATKQGGDPNRFTMNISSFAAARAPGAPDRLQVALFGTPRLPKDGQWSIARRPSDQKQPVPVDAAHPVPLTRGAGAGAGPSDPSAYTKNWRMLDPEDAQNVAAPKTFYGLLQGTGTAKTLLEHPLISDAGGAVGFANKPNLADVGALLGSSGLFPSLGSVLEIPSTEDLPLVADGFKRTYSWPIAEPERSLLSLGIAHIALAYKGIGGAGAEGELVIDATPGAAGWSLTLRNISFVARADGFGDLVTIGGEFRAGAGIAPGFVAPGGSGPPDVALGPALSPVQDILTGLKDIVKGLGGDAEFDVGFSGQQLSVKQGITLPTIPLGFGEVTDVMLELGFAATIPSEAGFHVGLGSREDPFHWLVSPLAGTGAIVIGVEHGKLDIYIEAGIGVGLGISVVVASGSASIVISLSVEIGEDQVDLAAMLTGNAEVEVLGGVASASLTLSAGVHIDPTDLPDEVDLTAEVSVGIHISICWVIDIDFDGAWSFSESIDLPDVI